MWKTIGCIALLAAAGCRWSDSEGARVRVFVSPDGKKGNTGSYASPFATLEEARDAVRHLRVSETGTIEIVLKDGVYELDAPFVLGPKDSGVVYKARTPGKAIISGGRKLTGWQVGKDGIWVTDAAWLKGREPFKQLFADGVRRTCARTPNEGYFYTRRLAMEGAKHKQAVGAALNKDEIPAWIAEPGVRFVLFHNWVNSYNRISEYDAKRGFVRFARTAGSYFLGTEIRYYLENAHGALDMPGEWFADAAAGKVYYCPMPGERPDRTEMKASYAGPVLVQIAGDPAKGRYVEGTSFEGIAFRHAEADLSPNYRHSVQGAHTQRGAVTAKGFRGGRIENCTFAGNGEHAVSLLEGCVSNIVRKCLVSDMGGGGIYLSDEARKEPALQTVGNIVDNNFIHDCGIFFRAACGVFLGGAANHNAITHNEISNLSWMGIHQGWSWSGRNPAYTHHNEIAWNHIHHIGNGVLNDIGGIYTLGISTGTVLHHNLIHDVTRFERGREGYGGWGIYLDAGSSEILVENNVVHDTRDGGFHLHNDAFPYGNTVRNNIFAFSQSAELIRNNDKDNEVKHIAVLGNIVYSSTGLMYGGGNWKSGGNFTADRNVYWTTAPEMSFGANRDFAAWRKAGYDTNGLVADPLFFDAAKRDFRLKPESPAIAAGFAPIDISGAGLYGDASWRSLPNRVKPRPYEAGVAKKPAEKFVYEFEEEFPGDQPDGVHVSEDANVPSASVRVAVRPEGGQYLKVTDGAGLKYSHDPHLFMVPHLSNGVVRAAFDYRYEPGARLAHEWRSERIGERYVTGPRFDVTGDGSVIAGGRKLATIPPSAWVRFEVSAAPGSGQWLLKLQQPGVPDVATELTCPKTFVSLDWCGFISPEVKETVFYLDRIVLETVKP